MWNRNDCNSEKRMGLLDKQHKNRPLLWPYPFLTKSHVSGVWGRKKIKPNKKCFATVLCHGKASSTAMIRCTEGRKNFDASAKGHHVVGHKWNYPMWTAMLTSIGEWPMAILTINTVEWLPSAISYSLLVGHQPIIFFGRPGRRLSMEPVFPRNIYRWFKLAPAMDDSLWFINTRRLIDHAWQINNDGTTSVGDFLGWSVRHEYLGEWENIVNHCNHSICWPPTIYLPIYISLNI